MTTTIPDSQIAGAVKAAGWPQNLWNTAVAVALAESSGQIDVVNSIGASGLFQILRSAHPELFTQYKWDDPTQNAKMALIVYRNAGDSWSPWVTYTSGAYRQYLARAGKATGSPVAPDAVGSSVSSSGATTNLSAVGFWPRVGFAVGGGILILLALFAMGKLDSIIPGGKAISIARKVLK